MSFSPASLDAAAENNENFSLANLDAAAENNFSAYFLCECRERLECILLICITLISCCIGLLGNGNVIWILGFQSKRNPISTFIFNLAIADFGFLIYMAIHCINSWENFIPEGIPYLITLSIFSTTYMTGQFLLTAISIDRCVAVLFPIWHRCSRPYHLSTTICVLLWIFSFTMGGILCGILDIMHFINNFGQHGLFLPQFLVTALVCVPLMTISTVILFIKLCLKPKQKKQGRLLLMILIILLCFLFLTFPLNVFMVIANFIDERYFLEFLFYDEYVYLCSCLNSTVNPLIYFLVGRKKQGQSRESMKVIFQRVFKEDKASGEEQKSSNPLPNPL